MAVAPGPPPDIEEERRKAAPVGRRRLHWLSGHGRPDVLLLVDGGTDVERRHGFDRVVERCNPAAQVVRTTLRLLLRSALAPLFSRANGISEATSSCGTPVTRWSGYRASDRSAWQARCRCVECRSALDGRSHHGPLRPRVPFNAASRQIAMRQCRASRSVRSRHAREVGDVVGRLLEKLKCQGDAGVDGLEPEQMAGDVEAIEDRCSQGDAQLLAVAAVPLR